MRSSSAPAGATGSPSAMATPACSRKPMKPLPSALTMWRIRGQVVIHEIEPPPCSRSSRLAVSGSSRLSASEGAGPGRPERPARHQQHDQERSPGRRGPQQLGDPARARRLVDRVRVHDAAPPAPAAPAATGSAAATTASHHAQRRPRRSCRAMSRAMTSTTPAMSPRPARVLRRPERRQPVRDDVHHDLGGGHDDQPCRHDPALLAMGRPRHPGDRARPRQTCRERQAERHRHEMLQVRQLPHERHHQQHGTHERQARPQLPGGRERRGRHGRDGQQPAREPDVQLRRHGRRPRPADAPQQPQQRGRDQHGEQLEADRDDHRARGPQPPLREPREQREADDAHDGVRRGQAEQRAPGAACPNVPPRTRAARRPRPSPTTAGACRSRTRPRPAPAPWRRRRRAW